VDPWLGDACSLVDAFRSKSLSPLEALEASLGAIDRSTLNAFCHLDPESARAAARRADVSLPFGGLPIGVKEIDGGVSGWPDTHASLVFRDAIADRDSTQVTRLRNAGAIPIGLTNASEFGGVSCTHTKLHGTTRNPWNPDRTPGGSSGCRRADPAQHRR
jgi:Asp-tRNA(Asn)/Glu-tRNA(Gln) amidotransferase A subunit family amidase